MNLIKEAFAKCVGCGKRPTLLGLWRSFVGEGVLLEYHEELGGWLCCDCWYERADHSKCNRCKGNLSPGEIGVCQHCLPRCVGRKS
jgi:hypothetical protein